VLRAPRSNLVLLGGREAGETGGRAWNEMLDRIGKAASWSVWQTVPRTVCQLICSSDTSVSATLNVTSRVSFTVVVCTSLGCIEFIRCRGLLHLMIPWRGVCQSVCLPYTCAMQKLLDRLRSSLEWRLLVSCARLQSHAKFIICRLSDDVSW